MDSQPLNFSTIRGVILDMDGVLWRGAEILPGVPEFISFLNARGIPYVLATNNSQKPASAYVERLNGIGVMLPESRILTSGIVTANYIASRYPQGTPIYVVGGDGLKTLLAAYGFVTDPDRAQVVIGGLDTALTYEKIKIAGRRIMAGAEFLGTNSDASLPTADGFDPGAGATLAAIGTFSKSSPRTFGKPHAAMFEDALRLLGTLPEETLMIGDRLDTDILGAKRIGIRAVHVLTGVSSADDLSELPPDAVFTGLVTLRAEWEQSTPGDFFMPIYQQNADLYDRLVSREDVQGNLLKTLVEIASLSEGQTVIEFGAGTGRVTGLIAPYVGQVHAYDSSDAMLAVAKQKVRDSNVRFAVADNRKLPEETASADVSIEGWSFGHWTGWTPDSWQTEIGRCLAEMERVTKPDGVMIVIETLGTGSESGVAPNEQLDRFYQWLESEHGFTRRAIRTDYRFGSIEEAQELISFFFGADMASRFAGSVDLPEVTGIWWKRR